jgi:hypothetical protein
VGDESRVQGKETYLMHPQEQDCFFFCLLHRVLQWIQKGKKNSKPAGGSDTHLVRDTAERKTKLGSKLKSRRTHTRYLVGEECMLAQHDCLECLRSVKEHTRHAYDVCPPHRSVSAKAQHATKS